jgi:uncharacterized YccA/Bax inhibitor family protein
MCKHPKMHTGNPALSEKVVSEYLVGSRERVATMTVTGTALKTLVLLVFLVGGGAWGWSSATKSIPGDIGGGYGNTTVTIPGGFWLASFAAFFVAMFLIFNPRRAALLGVVYALLEGYCLGAISAMFNAQTEGIVSAAVLATVSVFVVALFLYLTRIVRPTQKMAFAVTAGLGGLILLYLFVSIVAIFNWEWLYSDQFRTMGIAVSVIAIVLAALSLTLDFGTIEAGVEAGAPKYMEWYCGYGLMVTLIWLYITMLRLLALLARNR